MKMFEDLALGDKCPFSYSPSLTGNPIYSHPIGSTVDGKMFGFTGFDRAQHTHVIGGTGRGKSKLLELLIRQDIQNRNVGLMLLDPHGSLYQDILNYSCVYYPHLADRFILFHPANLEGDVVGFNPIVPGANNIDFVVSSLVSAVLKISGQFNVRDTPRINRWLTNIFYILIHNDLTLLESAPLISTSKQNLARDKLLSKQVSQLIIEDWQMYNRTNDKSKMDIMEGSANRLRDLLSSQVICSIIGQKTHTLNLLDAMNSGKIVLVNMNPSTVVSPEAMKLLGTLLINEVFRCALNRNYLDPHLKRFNVIIDEFSDYVTRDVAKGLDQTRKFNVFFTLAHQQLSQIKNTDEELYGSIMTNCANKVVFGACSADDTKVMVEEMYTGHLDLLSIKDELYRTREKHHQELFAVKSYQSSTSRSQGWQEGNSTSDTHSTAMNSASSRGESFQGDPWEAGHNQKTQHKSNSQTNQSAQSQAFATSSALSGSTSETSGNGVSYVPFNRIEEVLELSNRSYWSLDELKYLKTGDIKNQGVGKAHIRTASASPRAITIQNVASVYRDPYTFQTKWREFQLKAIRENSDCCLTRDQAIKSYQLRQIEFFGHTLEPLQGILEVGYRDEAEPAQDVFDDD